MPAANNPPTKAATLRANPEFVPPTPVPFGSLTGEQLLRLFFVENQCFVGGHANIEVCDRCRTDVVIPGMATDGTELDIQTAPEWRGHETSGPWVVLPQRRVSRCYQADCDGVFRPLDEQAWRRIKRKIRIAEQHGALDTVMAEVSYEKALQTDEDLAAWYGRMIGWIWGFPRGLAWLRPAALAWLHRAYKRLSRLPTQSRRPGRIAGTRGRPFDPLKHYEFAQAAESLSLEEICDKYKRRREHVRMSVGWAREMWRNPMARLSGRRPAPSDRQRWQRYRCFMRPMAEDTTLPPGIRPDIHQRVLAKVRQADKRHREHLESLRPPNRSQRT